MPKANVFLANDMSVFYFEKDKAEARALKMLAENGYQTGPTVDVPRSGEDAAEEVFDLSNNPSRQDERMTQYGHWRSLSVGDIVECRGEMFLCMSFGWKKIV